MRKWVSIFLCFFMLPVFATRQVLNVYNWSGYIPQNVITLFQKETGIKLNYSMFQSNEELYTKLKTDPNSSYDIVVPTSYLVEQMRDEGMLTKLDKRQLPNFKYLNTLLLNKSHDPGNQYSVPYLWGTTGIIVNRTEYPPGTITSWKDLWQPRFKNQIIGSNATRDMFGIAFKALGYSINDTDPQHIKEAYLKLRTLLPNILSFEADGAQQTYVNEDANIGIVDSGNVNMVIQENSNYYYIYPKDGVLIWMDNMVIPKNAAHIENAYKFINFVLRPDVAKMISIGVGYSSPNAAAVHLMPKAVQQNPIITPSAKDLQNTEIEGFVDKSTLRLYLKYWEMLKIN